MRKKEKGRMGGFIFFMVIVVILGTGGFVGYSFLAKEHQEARSLPLDKVDFANLNDGTYVGDYSGGMYRWRENSVEVVVSSGEVVKIDLLKNKENRPAEFTNELFDRVIVAQSLHIDTISGATLTSKAYLQGVENALVMDLK